MNWLHCQHNYTSLFFRYFLHTYCILKVYLQPSKIYLLLKKDAT